MTSLRSSRRSREAPGDGSQTLAESFADDSAFPSSTEEGEARRCLRRAASLAVAGATAGRRSGAAIAEDLPVALTDMILLAMSGAKPAIPKVASPVPLVQLVADVRRTLLEESLDAERPLSPEMTIRILHAIERVQMLLEEDSGRRFVTRFASSDALSSVVELAHDMRSPLASVLFLVDTIRKGQSGSISALQERQLGLVYGATFGLSSMVNDLIELARGGERLTESAPIPFSVSELILSMHDIVKPIAEEKRLGVQLQMPEGDYRLGHPIALSRVLLNLTTNALKFTDEGSVSVSAVPASRSTLEFVVEDTGRGIPPSVLPNVFDAFRPSERGRAGGFMFSSAGLGLAICQKLVRAMGGELTVESPAQRGTRFRFALDLPLAPRI